MRTFGIVRKIDELGRIVIPKEIRKALFIENGDDVEILFSDDAIIIKKYVPHCVFCSGSEGLEIYNDKCICRECRKNITDLDRK